MTRDRAARKAGTFATMVGLDEWPTWAMLFGTYAVWGVAVYAGLPWWLSLPLLAIAIAQHSSLQHEVLHGHPTQWNWINELLVTLPVGLFIPYRRFKDTHLQHHFDPNLTDPYDDPESNYLYPEDWEHLPGPLAWVLRANMTLAGRIVFGPAVGLAIFYRDDFCRLFKLWDPRVWIAWLLHIPALAILVVILPEGVTATYLVAAYIGMALIRVRSFLEHQAHESVQGRTVIIEDRGFWAMLFLNNNFHLVHHAHPQLPWYQLPGRYRARKDRYLAQNHGYRYRNYAEVFRTYFFRRKDDAVHPIWYREGRQNPMPVNVAARRTGPSA